jgi:hypothetical protein
MGTLQELISLIGPTGAPAVVVASTYGAFEFVERMASERAKSALAERLKSIDVRKSAILPEGTYETFQRLFGMRHFSTTCIMRSACFSFAAFVVLFFAAFFLHYSEFSSEAEGSSPIWAMFNETDFDGSLLLLFVLWVLCSFVIDFFSLYKTRLILRFLRKQNYRTMMLVAVLAADIVVGFLSFFILFNIFSDTFTSIEVQGIRDTLLEPLGDMFYPLKHFTSYLAFYGSFKSVESVLFYSSMVPSAFLWLFIASVFIVRGIIGSEQQLKWLIWFFDIDRSPFRSVGVVAGALAGFAVGCVLLISALIDLV